MIDKEIYQTTINLLVLGYLIKRLRDKQSLSLRGLAEQAKQVKIDDKHVSIDQSFISYIERGERVMSYQILTALASALNVNPRWLLTMSLPVHPRIQGHPVKSPADSGFSDIATQFDGLVKQAQEVIVRHLFGIDVDTFVNDFLEYNKVIKSAQAST